MFYTLSFVSTFGSSIGFHKGPTFGSLERCLQPCKPPKLTKRQQTTPSPFPNKIPQGAKRKPKAKEKIPVFIDVFKKSFRVSPETIPFEGLTHPFHLSSSGGCLRYAMDRSENGGGLRRRTEQGKAEASAWDRFKVFGLGWGGSWWVELG